MHFERQESFQCMKGMTVFWWPRRLLCAIDHHRSNAHVARGGGETETLSSKSSQEFLCKAILVSAMAFLALCLSII